MEKDSLAELRSDLWRVLDVQRGARPLDLSAIQSALEEAKLPLDWRTALLVGEMLGSRSEFGLPRHVVEFLARYAQLRDGQSLLDPFVRAPSLLAAVADRSGVARAVGLVPNSEVHAFATALHSRTIEWRLGAPLSLLPDVNEQFDFIVCAPPLGWRIRGISGDASYRVLTETSERLTADGEIVFLLAESFNFARDAARARERLAADDLLARAIVAVPDGSFNTRMPMQLTFFSRGAPSELLFVARLTSQMDIGQLAQSVANRVAGQTAEVGRLIAPGEYTTWDQLGVRENLERLFRKMPHRPRPLHEVAAEIRTVELRAGEEFERAANAVYLPEIRGTPTLTPTSEGAQKRRYLEVILTPDLAHAEYVAAWLESTTGRLARDSMLSGTTIPRLSARTLGEMPVVLPPIDRQVEALRVDSQLRNLALQAGELRSRLWLNPGDVRSIEHALASRDEEESVDEWFEALPFPLASIGHRYIADASIEDKIARLLHFFEATAEFGATLLLSAVRSDPALYDEERGRLARADPSGNAPLERSSFGTWILIGRTLAKTLRRLLAEAATREGAQRLFGVSDERFPRALTSKELWDVLDDARGVRNSRAHGGIEGGAYRKRMLERLESLLLDLRSATGPMFTQVELIQPGEMTYRQGVFHHRARRLTGSNSIFRLRELDSVVALDEDYLYLVEADGLATSALQILPFFRLMAPPETDQSAVYFYSSRERSGALRFVSYHFEGRPEEPVEDPFLSELLDELAPPADTAT